MNRLNYSTYKAVNDRILQEKEKMIDNIKSSRFIGENSSCSRDDASYGKRAQIRSLLLESVYGCAQNHV